MKLFITHIWIESCRGKKELYIHVKVPQRKTRWSSELFRFNTNLLLCLTLAWNKGGMALPRYRLCHWRESGESWHTSGMAATPSSSKACLVSLLSPSQSLLLHSPGSSLGQTSSSFNPFFIA